jgi:hypothetical protein
MWRHVESINRNDRKLGTLIQKRQKEEKRLGSGYEEAESRSHIEAH